MSTPTKHNAAAYSRGLRDASKVFNIVLVEFQRESGYEGVPLLELVENFYDGLKQLDGALDDNRSL